MDPSAWRFESQLLGPLPPWVGPAILRPLGIRLTRAVIGGRGLLDLVARGWAALLGRSRTETSQSQPEDKDVSLSK